MRLTNEADPAANHRPSVVLRLRMPASLDAARTLDHLQSEDEFEDETFSGLAHSKLDLSNKSFTQCTFEAMSLNEVQLASCVFTDCRFVRCDLTMAKLGECSLRGVRFERTKLMGIDWSAARDLIFDVSFETCVLSYGVFVKRRMREVKFIDCTAHEADFSEADLTAAHFKGTDLRDARFTRANLTRADLSEARDYRIDPAETTLMKTRFSLEAALDVVARLGIIVNTP